MRVYEGFIDGPDTPLNSLIDKLIELENFQKINKLTKIKLYDLNIKFLKNLSKMTKDLEQLDTYKMNKYRTKLESIDIVTAADDLYKANYKKLYEIYKTRYITHKKNQK